MIRINLLATEMIKKEERNELLILAYALLTIAILACSVDYFAKVRSYQKLENRVSQSERELEKYQSILKQVETIQATKSVLETKRNVINTLMQNRLIYLRFMEDMLETLPFNLWFRNINTVLAADGAVSVTIDASALDNHAIADFVSTLTASPLFTNVELGAITTSAGAKTSVSNFRIIMTYKKNK